MKKTAFYLFLCLGSLSQSGLAGQPAQDLQNRLASKSVVIQGEPLRMRGEVRQYYSSHGDRLVWAPFGKKAKDFINVLSKADEDGLVSTHYHTTLLDTLSTHAESLSPDEMDLLLTDAYLNYAHDISIGRYTPRPKTVYWKYKNDAPDFMTAATEALDSPDPASRLKELAPKDNGYDRLKKALAEYRELAKKGGWQTVPAGPKLQKGDQGERVAALRDRLAVTGDLKKDGRNDRFDDATEEAVKRFQEENGMQPDGTVANDTLKVLNIPVEDRIRSLEVNMERRRWVEKSLGDRHIVVNIPDFHLFAVDGGKTALMMNAVVGMGREWKTPSLSSEITNLILNPQWHVPTNIIKKELLRKIEKNPDYVAHERMKAYHVTENGTEEIDPETFDWADASPGELRLVQKEGAGNALGRIKFMFPNPFDIYIHDTPQKKFFLRFLRALSHGCVRIEKPLELAEFVMAPSGISREEIEKRIAKGTNQSIPLKEPIPVHILYWTSWVDPNGRINFRNDIYGKDREVARVIGL